MLKHMTIAVALVLVAGIAKAQDWGDLDGTFVLKGAAPTPGKIQVTKDEAFCGKHGLVEELVVVNKDNKGLANVVIYLNDMSKPMIHPDYAKDAKAEVKIDN